MIMTFESMSYVHKSEIKSQYNEIICYEFHDILCNEASMTSFMKRAEMI